MSRYTYRFTRRLPAEWTVLLARSQHRPDLEARIEFGARWVAMIEYRMRSHGDKLENVAMKTAINVDPSQITSIDMLNGVIEIYGLQWGFVTTEDHGEQLVRWYKKNGLELWRKIQEKNRKNANEVEFAHHQAVG